MTTVVLKNLTRRFGSVVAVDNLNLEIASGEMVAFLGPSGCGKTTTLRMIAGLLLPSEGDVFFDNRSMLDVPTEKRGAVMVFQKHLLFPNMTIGENVGFGLRMQGMKKSEISARVKEMLELVRLPGFENRKAHELSGGQQQRVALARGLIIRPAVLLLDEPLANLDANLRLEMRELIRSIQQEMKITSIFVTHDQEEAVMLADRVALMFDGVLQQFDEPRAFYDRPRNERVARFFRNENFLRGTKQGKDILCGTASLTVADDGGRPDGEVLLTVRPEDVRILEASTENSVQARVHATVYMGTYTQYLLDVAGNTWRAHGPADAPYQAGDNVWLYLPPKRAWLLPAPARSTP
jgi:ABC-type Fe3+/spermidine/putrescine transport system ATPase subunit